MALKHAKIKPAADKRVLLFLAGIMWLGVGSMLLHLSFGWLKVLPGSRAFLFGGTGFLMALIIHHFGFLKIVDKNLDRLLPLEGTTCVFAFITWKSYVMIAVMVAMGMLLRHSPLPKAYLSLLYTGIGLALVLSSVRYLRVLVRELRHGEGRNGAT